MTVEDCEEVSRALSPALDVDDPIEKALSSRSVVAGHRPAAGAQVRFRAPGPAMWSRSRHRSWSPAASAFAASIGEVDDEAVAIERDQPADGEEPIVQVPYEAIAEARLVLTDDLIRDALKKDKKARQEAKKRRARARKAAKTGHRIEFQTIRRMARASGRPKWQSVQTGWSSCRSPMRSRARSRSTGDRHRGDGRRHPEGGALALRPGDQHPRRHQPAPPAR